MAETPNVTGTASRVAPVERVVPPTPAQLAPPVEPLRCTAVLTHHWLVRRRGGERVLEALAELLPDAPLYTLVADVAALRAEGSGRPALLERRIVASWLDRLPGARRHYPKLLPLMPLAARMTRLPEAELVVCSDAAIVKAMPAPPTARVVCYCHSPMRYVWDLCDTYARELPAPLRPAWRWLTAWLRRLDRAAADRVDRFVANSRHVAERINRHYGRRADVVYPPVELPAEPHVGPRSDAYLCVGHHVGYKRLDLAVEACVRLGRRLIVVGDGPTAARLRARRPPGVEFVGRAGDAELAAYYRSARALLFPGVEDFGIVPVEAQGHGCPVIACGIGGATETVIDGITGVLFVPQTADALIDAIRRFEAQAFDPLAMHAHAQRFGRRQFLEQMRAILAETLAAPPGTRW